MLIRVATVDDVGEHQIRIRFDGWPDQYSYWIDDDGPDIHPMGWCQKTGHPLEPPLSKAYCCESDTVEPFVLHCILIIFQARK
jgi:hypothetical protein